MTQTRKSGIAEWLKSGWVALLIAIVTVIFIYGTKTQAQADTERRVVHIEQNYVPKSEYQTLHEEIKGLRDDVKTQNRKLDLLIQDQDRIHGKNATLIH